MTERPQAIKSIFAKSKQNQRSTAHRFFLFDLYDRLRHTTLYTQWQRLLTWIRRFRAVTLTLRIFSFLFAALQAGTLVLLFATLLLAVLPLLLLSALTVLLCAALASRRANRAFSKKLAGGQAYVIFPDTVNSPFLWQHVCDLQQRGYAVILVSPYLFSPAGIRQNKFYTTLREESEHVFLVRRYYYFSLKKNVLSKSNVVYQF